MLCVGRPASGTAQEIPDSLPGSLMPQKGEGTGRATVCSASSSLKDPQAASNLKPSMVINQAMPGRGGACSSAPEGTPGGWRNYLLRPIPTEHEPPREPAKATRTHTDGENADCSESQQRTNLIWSADLQKFRHQVFMPVVTAIDQPQLALPLLETEHLENLACLSTSKCAKHPSHILSWGQGQNQRPPSILVHPSKTTRSANSGV